MCAGETCNWKFQASASASLSILRPLQSGLRRNLEEKILILAGILPRLLDSLRRQKTIKPPETPRTTAHPSVLIRREPCHQRHINSHPKPNTPNNSSTTQAPTANMKASTLATTLLALLIPALAAPSAVKIDIRAAESVADVTPRAEVNEADSKPLRPFRLPLRLPTLAIRGLEVSERIKALTTRG